MGGVDTVIPVDVYVPGCAARPEAIIDGVVQALGALDEKKKNMEKHPYEAPAPAGAADGSGAEGEAVLADGAPPEPPEEPVLPGDDVEVKYFGAAPEDEEAAEVAEESEPEADAKSNEDESAEDKASDNKTPDEADNDNGDKEEKEEA
jgi:hypothetical protein